MNRHSILLLAMKTFGQARLVTTLSSGLRQIEETVLEVKGERDGAWRPLGRVAFDQTTALTVTPSAKALTEDLNRAAGILQA